MADFVAGVDLGGTNIEAALMDAAGQTCGWVTWPTDADKGPTHVMQRIIDLVQYVVAENGLDKEALRGVGLGVPGLVNSKEGMSIFSPNLPDWRNIPIAVQVARGVGTPVIIDNDVRMSAWGEKLLGAGRGREDLICVTLGTGIGSGIFIQGEMFAGRNESAGEIGHMTVEKDGPRCNCGNHGCLELYASGRGIARRAREAMGATDTDTSLIWKLAEGDLTQITAATVYTAATKGDEVALRLVEETALYLGIGLANAANILNPQCIVLGGGVMRMGDLLLEPTRRVVRMRAMPFNRETEIVVAELGERAGAIGAAVAAKNRFMGKSNGVSERR